MMSQKLSSSIKILGMPRLPMETVMISFGTPPTFSQSKNLKTDLFIFSVKVASFSLLTTINPRIFVLMVSLEGLYGKEIFRDRSDIMTFPFWYFSYSLLMSHFPLALVTALIAFLEEVLSLQGNHLFFNKSSQPLDLFFLSYVNLVRRPFLSNP